MKKLMLVLLLLTAMVFPISAGGRSIRSTNEVSDIKNPTSRSLCVIYKDRSSNQIEALDLKKDEIAESTSINERMDIIVPKENVDQAQLLQEINQNDSVEAAFYDFDMMTQALPNDPLLNDVPYFYTSVQADKTWNQAGEARSVTVAVVDSGVDVTHPDLAGRTEAVIDEYANVTGNPEADDLAGHGTAIASEIVAIADNGIGTAGITGFANVRVLPYRCGGTYEGDSSISVAAFLAAMDDIAQNHPEVRVVSMSVGLVDNGTESFRTAIESIKNACDTLAEKNVILVACSGNNLNGEYMYPAALDNVISVGSVDRNNEASYFTNHNDDVEFVAPGENIPVDTINNQTRYSSGTSNSTPIVAAACAYLLSTCDASEQEVVEVLRETALDLGDKGRDDLFGYGLIRIKDAYNQLMGISPGDVNIDGVVNAIDALQVLRHAVYEISLSDGQFKNADVNGDGLVNSMDAMLILRYCSNQIDAF